MDELQSMFAQGERSVRGRLRVDMPSGMARNMIIPRLPEFLALHPQLEIELSSTDRRVDPVREGFDCVLRVGTLGTKVAIPCSPCPVIPTNAMITHDLVIAVGRRGDRTPPALGHLVAGGRERGGVRHDAGRARRRGLVPSLRPDARHSALVAVSLQQLLHAGPMHLLGNMLFLIVFGDNIEDAFGPVPFLLLYFVGGLAGDLFFVTSNPARNVPGVGASGCIATLAGAYLILYFSSPVGVRLMFLVFTVHTFHLGTPCLMLLYFGYDIFLTFSRHGVLPDGGGVNFVVHGMGFAIGIAVAIFARLYGVIRRYETLSEGGLLLGYWPSGLEPVRARGRRR